MNKTKFLAIAVVLLITTNLALIFMIFAHKGPRPNEPKKVIIEKLGLDDAQQEKYMELIKEHQIQLNTLDKKLLAEKAVLFNSLKFDNQNELQDSIINVLALTQKEIEQTHLNHFKALKLLCNPKQKENFNLLTDELINLFNPKRLPN